MRRAMLTGLIALPLCGPALAFEFDAKSFPAVLNARIAALDFPTRIYRVTCNAVDDGEMCVHIADKGVLVYVHTPKGGSALDYVGTSWDKTTKAEPAFDQATVALITLCSPAATADERTATMHALLDPIDKHSASSDENYSKLDGKVFVSKMTPGSGVMIKVIDPSAR